MNQFEYTAQCEGGAAISGTLEATGSAEATKQLSSMGLRNIDLRQARRSTAQRPLGSDDFIFFNEQLASLANTGICLDAGLRQLGKDIRSRRLRNVLDTVAADIERGQPLDQALEKRAPQMPALYARVIRAGVASGQLPATLLNLSHHLRLVAETRRLVVEALTYPATVLVLAFGVLCAVLVMVVPQFSEAFGELDVQLPSVTLAMIALARVLPELLLGLGIIILGLVTLFLVSQLSPTYRSARERVILAVPVFGSLICDSLRTRFLRAMAFGVDSGISLPEALRLSAGATASPAMSRDADRVASRVEQGASVYKACQGTRLIPAMFGYVVDVSSDGGNLRDALIQLSKAYESRAVHRQSLLRGWLAPLAVIGVGVVIGFLIVALFMPMMSLMQSI
ncbi:MAG: type II secretion system F family protein [Planctomycetota bacterium]|jgi:type II secretory pathway component PulF